MDMDIGKIMQMMNGGGNKDMSMLMQLLPQLMNNQNSSKEPKTLKLNEEEVNKTITKLYGDEE